MKDRDRDRDREINKEIRSIKGHDIKPCKKQKWEEWETRERERKIAEMAAASSG
jgi:hypothetical protein